ncbi:methyl-accepting chemotaxis protein [Halobacteroides halobius DSM 5150]|uniref:Methyl-accepting chemotaxis protein n=1 Tax=Halobacteroides halobius (strain ATCC 35273 / DSM 5150 / MD-1) TaxID=748449 RepID=L0K912_HALHC|nr:methyl-accepting chemotaxis protein [Halobacteroides halobius]AGB41506.1 methyl-accepting chemotaxis protein [Halobacteroides halobius DSM 5150]
MIDKIKNLSLRARFKLFVLVALLFIIIAGLITVNQVVGEQLSKYRVKRDLRVSYQILNEKYSGAWYQYDTGLYKGGRKINGNFKLVNYISQLTGGNVTIFSNRTNISSNIKKKNGTRLVGTKASDEVANIVLHKGNNFYGEMTILGKNYYVAYTPLKDSEGQIIGMMRVGTSEDLVADVVKRIIMWVVIILGVGIVIIQFILSKFLDRILFNPLDNIIAKTREMANGNFAVQVNLNRADEIGDLETAVNNMASGLKGMLQSINQAAERASSTSQQLSASSQQSTASLEEVSASIEDFTNKVENVNDNAQNTAEVTVAVDDLAQSGLEQMETTEERMKQIVTTAQESTEVIEKLKESSAQIEKIIKVISEVAEQTNLLALNASIEAARVGSTQSGAGQGFAVVAEEIRELAEETQDSVGNIKGIINQLGSKTDQAVEIIAETNSQIQSGAQDVQETGQFFAQIADKIELANNQVQEVADYSDQLLAGSQEISSATEEQVAAMQQISSSSQDLSNMAQELNMLVNHFEV